MGIFDFCRCEVLTGLCTLMVWVSYDWVFFCTSWSFVSCFAFAMVLDGFCWIGGLDMLTSYIYIYGGNVLCLDRCSFKELLSKRVDYSFHFYMEVCQFVYCLLLRTQKISSLPDLHNWEEYMDVEKVDEFDSISPVDFLRNHSFGLTLHSRNDGSGRTFREQCRKFMDRLVDAILGQQPVTGEFSQGLYAFCPEFLLEGDDRHMLSLFSKMIRVLESSGCLSSSESRTAVEEYSTFVVDARRRHGDCGASAEDIADVKQYLLLDYSFLSRKSLVRVFKLCCLVARKPRDDYPSVDLGLTNCQVSEWVIATCISGVQSCVSASDFKLSSFFTKFTMKEVRDAIDAGYDPWTGTCSDGQASFVKRYFGLFKARIDRKRGEGSQQSCAPDVLK